MWYIVITPTSSVPAQNDGDCIADNRDDSQTMATATAAIDGT